MLITSSQRNDQKVSTATQDPEYIRLLSFNMQAGIQTQSYHQYLTRSWQHLLPASSKYGNLQRISTLVEDFDVVALQETDAGSLRSGFLNQVEYIADRCDFPYWHQQRNRNLGKFAQHGNGVLSRLTPNRVEDHKLPGLVPGRGCILLEYRLWQQDLCVILVHLSLGKRARLKQIEYICQLTKPYQQVVIMGDMNSSLSRLYQHSAFANTPLRAANSDDGATFPSWKPRIRLDHILVSPGLAVQNVDLMPCAVSDHLPVAVEIRPSIH